jgi:cytochrome c553
MFLPGLPSERYSEKLMTMHLSTPPAGGNRIGWAGSIAGIVRVPVMFAAFVAVSACTGNQQPAGKPSAVNAAAAVTPEQVAGTLHVCSSCHGFDGRSISPTFPRLAGQQKDYLVAQLTAFRDKTRADPHARTYMWGMAAHLSDQMIQAIAAYYSAQFPVAGTPGASPQITAGAKLFAEGIPSGHVPACVLCHGAKAAGNGPIPRLAGQHQAYLVRQLEAFASKARANEIMHEESKSLTPEQISEVTAFVATQ